MTNSEGATQQITPLPQSLASMLLNLQRRRQLMRLTSPWVFASPTGKLWAERNFNRSWEKVRQFAQTKGVRPLPLHCTRHSYISWALAAGTPTKRISEWCEVSVAVLERTYAHVLPQIEPDLSFTAIPAVEENGDEAGTNGDARPRRRYVSNRKKW
jgi:integrase